MEECGICYCDGSQCKLVCGHKFCKGCIKEWYHKGTNPSCPMCRRSLYFKGLYKLAPRWAEEREEQAEEDAWLEQVNEIFEEPSEFLLYELDGLQEEYRFAAKMGLDFGWYMENYSIFDVFDSAENMVIYRDVFPHVRDMFVSKYHPHQNTILLNSCDRD